MKLTFYVSRRFLTSFLLVFAAFLVILTLIDMIEEVRRHPDHAFATLAGLALLRAPRTLYAILPLIAVLTAITFFLRLARTSELVAMRAAGRSAIRVLLGPMVTAFCLGAVAVALLNPIVAATSKRYDALSQPGMQISSDSSVGGDGLWMRQGDEASQWVIHSASASHDALTLHDVTFLAFAPDGTPDMRIHAHTAQLTEGAWILTNAKTWRLNDDSNPEATAQTQARQTLSSSLTPDQIRDSFGNPAQMSVWELPDRIEQLQRAGFSTRRHHVWLQMELALPLLMSTMVLVGAGFTMRHARLGHSGVLVLSALGSGIAVFFVRNFAQVLGESGQIPVILAAWTPPLAAMMLSVSLLLHLEDG